jgi:ferritin-like metal-binding protein YciE
MNVGSFRAMYIAELQELRSIEAQLIQALPNMAGMASHAELKQAIRSHLEETRAQQARLDVILTRHGAEPREHVDQAMQAMLMEAKKWAGMVQDQDLRDAGLIASAQRIEHYEIAVYGSLASWAKLLGLEDDLHALLSNLEEEKQTDDKLTGLAKRMVNPDAAAT